MSSATTHDPGHDPSEHIEAGVDIRRIVAVGVVSLVLFAISAVVGYFIIRSARQGFVAERGNAAPGKYVGQAEINIVDSVPFDSDMRVAQWQADLKKRLNGYGWVDKQARIIHVPIERGMQQVVDEAAKQPVSGTPEGSPAVAPSAPAVPPAAATRPATPAPAAPAARPAGVSPTPAPARTRAVAPATPGEPSNAEEGKTP